MRGLCGLGASSKAQSDGPKRASIGHKGLGFKSVLEVTRHARGVLGDGELPPRTRAGQNPGVGAMERSSTAATFGACRPCASRRRSRIRTRLGRALRAEGYHSAFRFPFHDDVTLGAEGCSRRATPVAADDERAVLEAPRGSSHRGARRRLRNRLGSGCWSAIESPRTALYRCGGLTETGSSESTWSIAKGTETGTGLPTTLMFASATIATALRGPRGRASTSPRSPSLSVTLMTRRSTRRAGGFTSSFLPRSPQAVRFS